jgi:hypothetical protein
MNASYILACCACVWTSVWLLTQNERIEQGRVFLFAAYASIFTLFYATLDVHLACALLFCLQGFVPAKSSLLVVSPK